MNLKDRTLSTLAVVGCILILGVSCEAQVQESRNKSCAHNKAEVEAYNECAATPRCSERLTLKDIKDVKHDLSYIARNCGED
jgi:hypothetical protein